MRYNDTPRDNQALLQRERLQDVDPDQPTSSAPASEVLQPNSEALGAPPVETPAAPGPQTGEPQRNGAHGAPTEQPSANASAEQMAKRRPAWIKPVGLVVGLIILVFAIIKGIGYWQYSQIHTSTDDAYLTSDIVQITPQVNGNIKKLYVNNNQHVQAGQLLFELDDSTYRADVAQAQANMQVAIASARGAGNMVTLTSQTGSAQVAQAQGGVAQATSGIGSAQADVARARAAVANAQAAEQSAGANVKTAQASLDAAIAARRRAVQAVASAQAQVATAVAGVNAAQAGVTSAQANADKAARDQQRYTILYNEDAISAQQLDVATAAATSARAQLDSARQALAQAREIVNQRQADLASARDAVTAADATIAQARAQVTAARDAVSAAQANVSQMQASYVSAQQNVGAAEAKRQQALGQLSQAETAPKQISVQRANAQTANAKILQAQAALNNAQIALQRTRIYAPASGTISADTAEVGQQVSIGQAVMAVLPDNDIWVTANFKETQLDNMHPGQTVEIDVDTFPGHTFHGHVNSLAAGTGATFALLPPDNATGNFTKVVQRLPVKITFDPKQPLLDQLRAGLSANVTVTTK